MRDLATPRFHSGPYFLSTTHRGIVLSKWGSADAVVRVPDADVGTLQRWKSGAQLTRDEDASVAYYCGLLQQQVVNLAQATGSPNVQRAGQEGILVMPDQVTINQTTLTSHAAANFIRLRQEIVHILSNELINTSGDVLVDAPGDVFDTDSLDIAAESLMTKFSITFTTNPEGN